MTLILMHVPKTAGTSLRQAVSSRYVDHHRLHLRGSSERDQIAAARNVQQGIRDRARLVTGEGRWGVHRAFRQECRYAVVIRDPVDRMVSLYRWLSDNPRPKTDRLIKNGFEPFALGSRLSSVDNGQVRLLAGHAQVEGDVPGETVQADHFDLAVTRLRAMAVVGVADDLSGFLEHLSAEEGWDSIPDLPHHHHSLNPFEAEGNVLDRIERRNRWDVMLYEEAVKLSGHSS